MKKEKLVYLAIIIVILIIWIIFLINFKKWNVVNNNLNLIKNNQSNQIDNTKDSTDIDINKIYGSIFQSWWNLELKQKIDNFKSENELWKSSFLSSFVWDYSNAIIDREKYCNSQKQNKNFCDKKQMNLKFSKITDTNWKILTDINLSVDWTEVWNLKDIKKIN